MRQLVITSVARQGTSARQQAGHLRQALWPQLAQAVLPPVTPKVRRAASYFGATSAPASLTVTPAVLSSIVVTPNSASVPLGRSQQFTATGVYTDGSMQNVTAAAAWGSTAPTVASVSSGLAVSAGQGTTTVSAAV